MKILITGATHGMGKGVAKILAGIDQQSHEVILLGRSKELCEALVRELKESSSNPDISMVLCDLTRLDDVKKAAEEINKKHKFLDGIFINAGLGYAPKRVETQDGFDSHFQVNYLSQFMLTLNLLSLLEKSKAGGRVVFNVTKTGNIFWDDMQQTNKWGYVEGIYQAMAAKRMFLTKLHRLYQGKKKPNLSFIGFQIPKTVWTNQINIIPAGMKIMATLMKFFGTFITIERCGEIIAPLFTESGAESLNKSGKLITFKKGHYTEMSDEEHILNHDQQDRLWQKSVELCNDKKTTQIAKSLGG